MMRQKMQIWKNRVQAWDRTGVALSSICVLHCVLTPLVLAGIPSLDIFVSNYIFHFAMAVILIVVASLAFVHGYKRHKNKGVLLLGALGLAMLLAALALSHKQHHVISSESLLLNLVGSFCLILAHFQNMASCRNCDGHN